MHATRVRYENVSKSQIFHSRENSTFFGSLAVMQRHCSSTLRLCSLNFWSGGRRKVANFRHFDLHRLCLVLTITDHLLSNAYALIRLVQVRRQDGATNVHEKAAGQASHLSQPPNGKKTGGFQVGPEHHLQMEPFGKHKKIKANSFTRPKSRRNTTSS